MTKLKPSEYNFIYDDLGKDQIVMYNSFTGALAVVKELQYAQFINYLETGEEIKDKEFLDNLLKCGYLVPEDIDERFIVKERMMHGRYDYTRMSLTIAPTMACNFRCVYCFEQGHYGERLMDEETQKNLMDFVKKHIAGVKSLYVTWFGGEPLIGMPVIEGLSRQLIELCEEKEITYSAGIVTNGYLLTKENAERLKECQVGRVQITLDGPKEIHDVRRPLVNGNGTYDIIMKNIMDVKEVLPISLRINVDYDNIAEANKVMNFLREKDMLKYVSPYLGLVEPYNDNYQEDKCFSDEMYSKYNLKFLIDNHIPLQKTYPRARMNHCIADACNGWVIDDTGKIYKCWNDIGIPEKAIGNINLGDNYLQRTDLIEKYSSFEPTLYDECKECKLLPICIGGCPHSRMEGRRVCEQRKFYMQEYLVECTKALLKQKHEQQNSK